MKTLDDNITNIKQDKYSNENINSLLQQDKKIVAFMGASKNGTSFILNNVADILTEQGVDVAILDATQNRHSYYIYTKNDPKIRNIAYTSIENLTNGIAEGIKVKENLTVYTAIPGKNDFLEKEEMIIETLLKNHTLILIDCDFKTPIDYFAYAQEIYLVQSMDVLTIQPLTEALSEIEGKGILDESKLRIIINKYIELDGVTEREIIGGMAFYNEPTLSYMKQLFNKNTIKYMVIPFQKEVYVKYLQQLADCEINSNVYSREIIELLKQLANNIYTVDEIEKDEKI